MVLVGLLLDIATRATNSNSLKSKNPELQLYIKKKNDLSFVRILNLTKIA